MNLRWLTEEFAPADRRALGLVLIAIFISGVMVGLTIPLISLMLNARGLSPSLIGLNTAMLGVAALVALPLLPGLHPALFHAACLDRIAAGLYRLFHCLCGDRCGVGVVRDPLCAWAGTHRLVRAGRVLDQPHYA